MTPIKETLTEQEYEEILNQLDSKYRKDIFHAKRIFEAEIGNDTNKTALAKPVFDRMIQIGLNAQVVHNSGVAIATSPEVAIIDYQTDILNLQLSQISEGKPVFNPKNEYTVPLSVEEIADINQKTEKRIGVKETDKAKMKEKQTIELSERFPDAKEILTDYFYSFMRISKAYFDLIDKNDKKKDIFQLLKDSQDVESTIKLAAANKDHITALIARLMAIAKIQGRPVSGRASIAIDMSNIPVCDKHEQQLSNEIFALVDKTIEDTTGENIEPSLDLIATTITNSKENPYEVSVQTSDGLTGLVFELKDQQNERLEEYQSELRMVLVELTEAALSAKLMGKDIGVAIKAEIAVMAANNKTPITARALTSDENMIVKLITDLVKSIEDDSSKILLGIAIERCVTDISGKMFKHNHSDIDTPLHTQDAEKVTAMTQRIGDELKAEGKEDSAENIAERFNADTTHKYHAYVQEILPGMVGLIVKYKGAPAPTGRENSKGMEALLGIRKLMDKTIDDNPNATPAEIRVKFKAAIKNTNIRIQNDNGANNGSDEQLEATIAKIIKDRKERN